MPHSAEPAGPAEAGGDAAHPVHVLTPHGHAELTAFGVDTERLARRRASVRYCVDWAERRHHLAGGLGAALTAGLFALEWLRHGTYRRVVRLTGAGRAGLATSFGIPAGRLV